MPSTRRQPKEVSASQPAGRSADWQAIHVQPANGGQPIDQQWINRQIDRSPNPIREFCTDYRFLWQSLAVSDLVSAKHVWLLCLDWVKLFALVALYGQPCSDYLFDLYRIAGPRIALYVKIGWMLGVASSAINCLLYRRISRTFWLPQLSHAFRLATVGQLRRAYRLTGGGPLLAACERICRRLKQQAQLWILTRLFWQAFAVLVWLDQLRRADSLACFLGVTVPSALITFRAIRSLQFVVTTQGTVFQLVAAMFAFRLRAESARLRRLRPLKANRPMRFLLRQVALTAREIYQDKRLVDPLIGLTYLLFFFVNAMFAFGCFFERSNLLFKLCLAMVGSGTTFCVQALPCLANGQLIQAVGAAGALQAQSDVLNFTQLECELIPEIPSQQLEMHTQLGAAQARFRLSRRTRLRVLLSEELLEKGRAVFTAADLYCLSNRLLVLVDSVGIVGSFLGSISKPE